MSVSTAQQVQSHVDDHIFLPPDHATLAQFDDYDERDNLGRISCPALVVYGRESTGARPEMMREMAEAIPRARLADIGSAGHLPQMDNPEEFTSKVLEFCLEES